MAKLHEIFVHVAYGHGSVFLWWCYDTLCTSSFVYDVMNTTSITVEILIKFCSVTKTSNANCKMHTGAKSAIYDCLIWWCKNNCRL